jgi:NAD-dependent dihydropyrimidine dehydrogenase PreA subunit
MPAFDVNWPVPIIDLQLCNGCGKCVEACPAKALSMQDGKAIVAWPEACIYAGLCEDVCPVKAISRPFILIS